jgi:hypothetical protein
MLACCTLLIKLFASVCRSQTHPDPAVLMRNMEKLSEILATTRPGVVV